MGEKMKGSWRLLILLTLTLGCAGEQAQVQTTMAPQTTAPPIIKTSFVELGTLEEFETNMMDALENPIFAYLEYDGVDSLVIYQGDSFKNSQELTNLGDDVPAVLMKKGTVAVSEIPASEIFSGAPTSIFNGSRTSENLRHKIIVDYVIDNLIEAKPNEIAYMILNKSCNEDDAKFGGSKWDTIGGIHIFDINRFDEHGRGDVQKLDIDKFWFWCNRDETLTIFGFTESSVDFFFK